MKLHRGSTLLTVLLVVLAITVLGSAMVVTSGRHLATARVRESNVGLANCAMAVRQYVASQITGGGTTDINFSVPATGTPIKLQGGHYENIQVTLAGYKLSAPPSFGTKSSSSVQNIANSMPIVLGTVAAPVTGAAVCTDQDGHTYEVEFSYVGQ